MTRNARRAEEKVLVSAPRIARRVAALGREISRAFGRAERPVVMLVILKGAFVFAADLIRVLTVPCEVEFIRARSYRGTRRGRLRVEFPDAAGLRGRDVLVVDGVLDSGATLRAVLSLVRRAKPRSTRTCVLLRKNRPGRESVKADFVGFKIPDVFVTGYGMDASGLGREKSEIMAPARSAGACAPSRAGRAAK